MENEWPRKAKLEEVVNTIPLFSCGLSLIACSLPIYQKHRLEHNLAWQNSNNKGTQHETIGSWAYKSFRVFSQIES